jgi:SAM-dependent methyltransferase
LIELPSSIPIITKYEELLSSDLFRILEYFSNTFIKINHKALTFYAVKWVKDPFHQWSRQWEYPFVYSKIINKLEVHNTPLKILDAGSGITFFPYFLKSQFPSFDIICGDVDLSINRIYDQVNKSNNNKIKFMNMDLGFIPFENECLDIVYSISVIEHIDNYLRIIDEFYRIIKPGGKLIITFDISLDGEAGLSPGQSEELVDYTFSRFQHSAERSSMHDQLVRSDIVTTQYAYKINPKLLPWQKPSFLKSIINSYVYRLPLIKFPHLVTIYCLICNK